MKFNKKHVLFLFLVIILARGLYLNLNYSITADESIMFANGYAILKTHDYTMGQAHPPLMKMTAALPYLLFSPKIYLEPGWQVLDLWKYGDYFVFLSGNNPQTLIFLGRLSSILISLVLAIYLFYWASELFGFLGGFVALVLYTFEPTIIALSSNGGNDIGVAAFMFIAIYHFNKALEINLKKDWILTAVFAAFALASKHSGMLLLPSLFIFAIIYLWSKPHSKKDLMPYAKNALICVVIILVLINIVYSFQGTFTQFKNEKFQSSVLKPLNSPALSWIPSPLPYYYLNSLDQAFGLSGISSASTGETYILGSYREDVWYYFIIALAIKVPIAIQILTLLSIAIVLFGKSSLSKKNLALFLIVPIIMLCFFSAGTYKVGVRHLLPMFPFLILIACSVVTSPIFERKIARYVVLFCLVWFVIASIIIHPYHFSYFNEFIGGPKNGEKYLIDSNIDWGQDLVFLKDWMIENNIPGIHLSYFGHDQPSYRGILYDIPSCYELSPGWTVVSVNHLHERIFTGQPQDCYSFLRNVTPTEKITYSLYAYYKPN